MNRFQKASLLVTFALDEPGGCGAFMVRRLGADGLVVANEYAGSITLHAITIPQHTTPPMNSQPTYGTSGATPPVYARDDSTSSTP